ncbi:hypothetical protein LQ318_03200 [Aliifodinibius salicampi]|uniref:Uncharacterized protein n=1 Tax=Fodinibius salicampi TaxID=1920655 RepID=A0ABT3PVN3_9BACT|nr:hypothetical protein [Fodinibius salicampi]MCW9711902.1 hypothetical protein [Fodinibius salicampi]
MIPWVDILLIFIGIYASFELIKFARGRGRLKFLGLTIAAGIFAFLEFVVVLNSLFTSSTFAAIASFIIEWGHLFCLAFILSSMAIFIRESKPVFAQFPMAYTALPLFIVISYFFVLDNIVLKEWLFFLYQAGALIIALMMYGVYTYRLNKYIYILAGVVLFLISFITYWSFSGGASSWKYIISVAILTTVFGYKYAHKY